jgi:hypothetical protein
MKLNVYPSWRSHTVGFEKNPTRAKLRQLILDEVDVARGFTTLHAPCPALDDTWVKVIGNDKTLLVGVCAIDTIPWLTKHVTLARGGEH